MEVDKIGYSVKNYTSYCPKCNRNLEHSEHRCKRKKKREPVKRERFLIER